MQIEGLIDKITNYSYRLSFIKDDRSNPFAETYRNAIDMYARLMEVLVKELSSGASTIQSSMSAYTGGTTQFLGGVAQFESSVEQMKISSMITVMEKITELGIQAAQEKGSSSIIGYSRIFHQAYYGQSKASLAVEQSILSSISMWKEFLALLTASMKIEGSFAAGTPYVPAT